MKWKIQVRKHVSRITEAKAYVGAGWGWGWQNYHTTAFNAPGFSVVEKSNLKKYYGRGVRLTQTRV